MAFTAHAQSLTFTTFAGPSGGAGSVDGTGNAARFSGLSGVATDSDGNVYVADHNNNTIRKITPAGVVTTLAGLAHTLGSADGAGSDARFDKPRGIATDRAGNIYVADSGNDTIRKVTPAGVVTTLAGSASGAADGTGTDAGFSAPTGVATDGTGNIYVADRDNHTIRKITPAGVVTTLAGSAGASGDADGTGSDARFDEPVAVATDTGGNVYVADNDNHTIRRVTPAGMVTTLAGSGQMGSGDGTGSEASFDSPTAVATDSNGNVYVADGDSHTIRKITPAGVVTTLAGSAGVAGDADGIGSESRFDSPDGVATDKDGNVYVTESETIRKITPAGEVTSFAGSRGLPGSANGTRSDARFNKPEGVATDRAGNVYVADSGNHTIRKITPAGEVTTLAGSPGRRNSVDGTGTAARFIDPVGVAADSEGNIYVAEQVTIRKITPAGVVTTLAGSPVASGSADGTGSDARFDNPSAVTADRAGNVYVADTGNNTIRKVTPKGVVTTFAGSAGLEGSADGTGSAARFRGPSGVATDSGGNLYIADRRNQIIRKITAAGVVTTLAGTFVVGRANGTASEAQFAGPTGVATDSGGNVYVSDIWVGITMIRKITPAAVVTTLAGSLPGSEDGTGAAARFGDVFPGLSSGVARDSSGNVYVADVGNHKIRIGRPALADEATIDATTGPVGTARQLGTSPQTATSSQWRIIRQPSGSIATLSSASIPNPRFTPDVPDLYIFQLTASKGEKTSITTVSLKATPPIKP